MQVYSLSLSLKNLILTSTCSVIYGTWSLIAFHYIINDILQPFNY